VLGFRLELLKNNGSFSTQLVLFVVLCFVLTSKVEAQQKIIHGIRHTEQSQIPNNAPFRRALTPRVIWKEVRYHTLNDGKVVADYVAHHDLEGHRLTPGANLGPDAKAHVILAGCSWTYGSGVNDDETFSSVLARMMPDMRVLNFGVPGGSISDHNYLWRYADLKQKVAFPKGVFVYVHTPPQDDRLLMSPNYMLWAPPYRTYFETEGEDIQFKGIAINTWSFKITKFMKRQGLEMYWLKFYSWLRPYHIKFSKERMAFHIAALKKSYLKQFPQGKFVVVKVSLAELTPTEEGRRMWQELADSKIEVWDIMDETAGKWLIKGDGHPNVAYHASIAEKLHQKIQELHLGHSGN